MDSTAHARLQQPTAARPLLGMTALAVEDSRYTCETLRRMCSRSGARLRRADSLQSARRHLAVYRPTIAIVDLGLPDGNGADLISDLSRASPRVCALLAISGDPFGEDVAIAAGADGFMAKPFSSLAAFQAAILRHLPTPMRPHGVRAVVEEAVVPDPLAYRDDIAHAADLLDDSGDRATLSYVAQFTAGVARSVGDHALASAAADLAAAMSGQRDHAGVAARLRAMVRARLSDRVAI